MALDSHHSSSSSSSSSSSYHVFLSFRGRDTRNKFTGNLYSALENKGVRTFLDNEELPIGEEIKSVLLTAIEKSRISIPIFSQDYASSKWCLQELSKILQCHDKNDQIILPIFLDVEPSDVRNQTGSFGEAFLQHKKNFGPEITEEWKVALKKVGGLKGWVLKEVEGGTEEKLVKLVVEKVCDITFLSIVKHPIGLDSRVNDLLSISNLESKDSKFVGICGMGGIGKTTVARSVYNQISKSFDGCSFLENVREKASNLNDLVYLQHQLLTDILARQKYDTRHVDDGSQLIIDRLKGKKVLIILDDVDHYMQMKALVGEPSWFGPRSRIIITSRNEHVLTLGGIDNNNIYKPKVLDNSLALQLFSLHCFRKEEPPEDYIQLSREVVSYAGGLPLTLEVLGSHLFNVQGREIWESALQKLKKIPPEKVHNQLKISYNGLDEIEKDIFLDIACYFNGMNREVAIYIWKDCGFYPDIVLTVLSQKSLVSIGDKDELRMHDQLRYMGRRIVHKKKPIGKRSRLLSPEEFKVVLEQRKKTRTVEGILLDDMMRGISHFSKLGWGGGYFNVSEDGIPYCSFRIEDFAMMPNLRLLIAIGASIDGNIEQLPSKLKWLCLQRCSLKILPSSSYVDNLVVLDLSGSNIEQVWNIGHQNKRFENLKVLNLSNCWHLHESPDFSGFPLLETLVLQFCQALENIHESIGQLARLHFLNLSDCFKLMELPKLPSSLIHLHAEECKFRRLPDVSNLVKLRTLDLASCEDLVEIQGLERLASLDSLDVSGCYELAHLQMKVIAQDSNDLFSSYEIKQRYEIGDNVINNKMILCVILELDEEVQMMDLDGILIDKALDIEFQIHRNGRQINCTSTMSFQFQMKIHRDIIGIYRCEGLSCFGFPLKSKDKIGFGKMKWIEDFPKQRVKCFFLGEDDKHIQQLIQRSYEMEEYFINSVFVDDEESQTLFESIFMWQGFKNLKKLDLFNCLYLAESPDFSGLPLLESLMLCKCKALVNIHESIGQLNMLSFLDLSACVKLIELPKLPSSLFNLVAINCKSLQRLPNVSNLVTLQKLCLDGCAKLTEIQGLESVKSLMDFDVSGCYNLTNMPMKVLAQYSNHRFSFGEIKQRYKIGDDAINGKMILCVVFKLEEEVQMMELEGKRIHGRLSFQFRIHRKKIRRINCSGDLYFNIAITHREIICIHHCKGLSWFRYPLKSEDEIEIVELDWDEEIPEKLQVKCFISCEDDECIRQLIPISSDEVVKDSNDLACDVDGGSQNILEQKSASVEMIDFLGMQHVDDGESHPLQEESQDIQRANKKRRHNDDEGDPSLSLRLTL